MTTEHNIRKKINKLYFDPNTTKPEPIDFHEWLKTTILGIFLSYKQEVIPRPFLNVMIYKRNIEINDLINSYNPSEYTLEECFICLYRLVKFLICESDFNNTGRHTQKDHFLKTLKHKQTFTFYFIEELLAKQIIKKDASEEFDKIKRLFKTENQDMLGIVKTFYKFYILILKCVDDDKSLMEIIKKDLLEINIELLQISGVEENKIKNYISKVERILLRLIDFKIILLPIILKLVNSCCKKEEFPSLLEKIKTFSGVNEKEIFTFEIFKERLKSFKQLLEQEKENKSSVNPEIDIKNLFPDAIQYISELIKTSGEFKIINPTKFFVPTFYYKYIKEKDDIRANGFCIDTDYIKKLNKNDPIGIIICIHSLIEEIISDLYLNNTNSDLIKNMDSHYTSIKNSFQNDSHKLFNEYLSSLNRYLQVRTGQNSSTFAKDLLLNRKTCIINIGKRPSIDKDFLLFKAAKELETLFEDQTFLRNLKKIIVTKTLRSTLTEIEKNKIITLIKMYSFLLNDSISPFMNEYNPQPPTNEEERSWVLAQKQFYN